MYALNKIDAFSSDNNFLSFFRSETERNGEREREINRFVEIEN